jgi:hypothetical protein
MTAEIIRKAVAAKLASEGVTWATLESLKIDKKEKAVYGDVSLEGEPGPIAVTAHYTLEPDHVQIDTFQTTRPWVTHALGYALLKHGGKIPLPGGMQGTMVRMML